MQEFHPPQIGRIYFLVKQHLQFFNRPHTHADVMRVMHDIRDELKQEERENTRLPQKRMRS